MSMLILRTLRRKKKQKGRKLKKSPEKRDKNLEKEDSHEGEKEREKSN